MYFNNPILRNIIAGDAKGLIGDDPKLKGREVYKTKAEVDAANAEARRFSKAHNTLYANDAYVAKNVGDPVVQYRTLDGKSYVPQQMPKSWIKNTVPDWVTEIRMDDEWTQPYYKDGNDIVFVDKKFFNHPKFIKPNPLQGLVASK